MFAALDFLYTPSADPAADRDHYVDVLGAEEVFAVEAGNERVAAVRFTESPVLLFAGHLVAESDNQRPFLIYRVDDFDAELSELATRGWTEAERFEIPHGPCCTWKTPSGQRIGVYQLTRPEVVEHFAGRHDF